MVSSSTPHCSQPQTQQSTVVASAVPISVAAGLSRTEFEELGTEELFKYLTSQKVILSDKVQGILRAQEIGGASLAVLNFDNLRAESIPAGVAVRMLDHVPRQEKPASTTQGQHLMALGRCRACGYCCLVQVQIDKEI